VKEDDHGARESSFFGRGGEFRWRARYLSGLVDAIGVVSVRRLWTVLSRLRR
jgi:hypothetical protein